MEFATKILRVRSIMTIAAVSAITCAFCFAGDKPENKKTAKDKTDTASTNQPPEELQYDHLRDPFWPIDWFPPGFGKTNSGNENSKVDKWEEAKKRIRITGISKVGNEYFAMVEGEGLVEEGGIVTIIHQGVRYRWKVDKITSKGVRLTKITDSRR